MPPSLSPHRLVIGVFDELAKLPHGDHVCTHVKGFGDANRMQRRLILEPLFVSSLQIFLNVSLSQSISRLRLPIIYSLAGIRTRTHSD